MQNQKETDILWQAMVNQEAVPEELTERLGVQEAYGIQRDILDRQLKSGKAQAGWKIALSSPESRQMMSQDEPVRGYLLQERGFESGRDINHGAISQMGLVLIESEFCFEVTKEIQGPGVSREQVLDAITAVAPAFEIAQFRVKMAKDIALGIADNVVQWGFVKGKSVPIDPRSFEWQSADLAMQKNGEQVQKVVVGETIDDHFELIAWLANHLAQFGQKIEPGQCILTGACTTPTVVEQGDSWRTEISGLGIVEAKFI